MKQLSLFDPPRSQGRTAIWSALDEEQRTEVVAKLARLLAQTATGSRIEPKENADE